MGEDGAAGQQGRWSATAHQTVSKYGGELPRSPAAPLPRWTLWIDDVPRPGWANMAIDQTLLDRADEYRESWLRLYQWQPHCLSFGRHEPATQRYDVERIQALGLDTVRRPTGGRAVWHGRELTYAVAAPNPRFGSLRAAYLEIHEMLRDALRALRLEVSLAPQTRGVPVNAGACFSQPAGGEVMVAGRKVIGSAQLRRGDALLQHGSVLLHDDQRIVLGLTRGAGADDPSRGSGQVLATPLAVPLGRPLQRVEVTEAITRAAAVRWPGSWQEVGDPEPVLHAASGYFPQFQSPAWTWAR
jgi:lipoyl(octanoyl) transferase